MRLFLFVILSVIFYSCANETAPTGGPKDADPPEMVTSDPKNGALNVKTREIIIVFNEFVKTDNPKEQIIITPRLSQEYTFTAKRDKLYIKLTEPLDDSTTYTINFREGIKDITEGNSPNNLMIAFSTGTYLDSLSVSGIVTDLLTNKVVENYSVFLYDKKDTITFFNGSPLYLTKTDKKGQYKFDNLKAGTYDLYALRDKNKNLMVDVKSESYGFYPQTIQLDSSLSKHDIVVHNLNVSPIEMISNRQNGTAYEVKYNKSLTNYNVIREDSLPIYSNYTDETNTIIRIYNPYDIKDSLAVVINVFDSVNYNKKDTLFLKFEETARKPLEFKMTPKVDKIFINSGEMKADIRFSKPIEQIQYDSIYVYIDSLHLLKPEQNLYNWNDQHDVLSINYTIDPKLLSTEESDKKSTDEKSTNLSPSLKPTITTGKKDVGSKQLQTDDTTRTDQTTASGKQSKPEKKPYLYLGTSAFISAEMDSTKSKEIKLVFTTPELYGIILVEVKTLEKSYIVQLLDLQNQVIQTQNNIDKFTFNNVAPGDYKIRVLIDRNNDGLWNPGNIMENIMPEPVIYFKTTDGSEKITIRANWELGPNLIEF